MAVEPWELSGELLPGGCVSIGNFDGVHRGHQALLAEVRRRAAEVGGQAVAVTFDPRPITLLRPDLDATPLTTLADRVALLRRYGADVVVTLCTTPLLLEMPPEMFFGRVLRGGLRAKSIVEGYNFHFGHDRRGNTETLKTLCAEAEMGCHILPQQSEGDAAVSSSRVREALLTGDVTLAKKLLGRPYCLRGIVVTGQQRGRTLGFPTANLGQTTTIIPRDGVYAARVEVGGAYWAAAVNVGPNPTFGESARKVEAHLIGYDGDIYGWNIAVEFTARLRGTRSFAGVAELTEQVRADVAAAAKLFGVTEWT